MFFIIGKVSDWQNLTKKLNFKNQNFKTFLLLETYQQLDQLANPISVIMMSIPLMKYYM